MLNLFTNHKNNMVNGDIMDQLLASGTFKVNNIWMCWYVKKMEYIETKSHQKIWNTRRCSRPITSCRLVVWIFNMAAYHITYICLVFLRYKTLGWIDACKLYTWWICTHSKKSEAFPGVFQHLNLVCFIYIFWWIYNIDIDCFILQFVYKTYSH